MKNETTTTCSECDQDTYSKVGVEGDFDIYECSNCGRRAPSITLPARTVADLFGQNPFPNSRCPVCGNGLSDEYRCQTPKCQEYGKVVPIEQRT